MEYAEVKRRYEAGDDSNVFHQFAGKTSTVTFHDYYKAYADVKKLPNVERFIEIIENFKGLLINAGPDANQIKNIDFMLNIDKIFSMIVYGNIIAEDLEFDAMPDEVVDRIYEVLLRDIAEFALNQLMNFDMTAEHEKYFEGPAQKARSESRTGSSNLGATYFASGGFLSNESINIMLMEVIVHILLYERFLCYECSLN